MWHRDIRLHVAKTVADGLDMEIGDKHTDEPASGSDKDYGNQCSGKFL